MGEADPESAAASNDRRFYLLAGCVVLLLINLPVAWGYLHQEPPGQRFVGTLDDFPADLYYHMSFATQVVRGNLLFEDKYNGAQAVTRAFPNALFLAVGLAQRAGLGAEAAYHLARNLAALLLLFAVHQLCVRVVRGRAYRRVGFTLAVLGSGFAWIPYLVGVWHYPGAGGDFAAWHSAAVSENGVFEWVLDGWLLELSPYWLMETEFVAPTAMALGVLFWAWFPDPRTWRNPVRLAGLSLLPVAVGLSHPHDAVNIAATGLVLVAWALASDRSAPWVTPRLAWLAVPALPVYAWLAWLLVHDPVIREYASLTDPENRLGLIAGLGTPVAILAWRLPDLVRASWEVRAVLAAAATGVVLFCMPLSITGQYYNLHGVSIFVALAAVAGLERFASSPAGRSRAAWVAGCALVLAPWTNASVVAVQMLRVANPGSDFHVSQDLHALLGWARGALPQEAVVLARPEVAQYVPYLTGCRVVLAQPEQTAGYFEIEARFDRFVAHLVEGRADGFLDEARVTHVLVDPVLRTRLGAAGVAALRRLPGVSLLRREGEFELYEHRARASRA